MHFKIDNFTTEQNQITYWLLWLPHIYLITTHSCKKITFDVALIYVV